jgi:hypothetical protein
VEGIHVGSRAIRLQAGRRYPLRVEYIEKQLEARLRLFWTGPGQPRDIVPAAHFSRTVAGPAGDGLRAVYRPQQYRTVYARRGTNLYAITFEWPEGELALPPAAPTARTHITLLGYSGELPWQYRDGTLYVDLSKVPAGEVPDQRVWTVKLANYLKQGEAR